MNYKYTYGPVLSRRLGQSLGIDIIPPKSCSLSCIYCQIGETPKTTLERKEFAPVGDVLSEVKSLIASGLKADWLTFGGSGEPTLHSGLGRMINGVKEMSDTPVCVITNGTLLWDADVRRDLNGADAVMPSLDSAVESTFNKVCRPHPGLNLEKIIEGIEQFRREYDGKIWLEILFVQDINDSQVEVEALGRAIERINPDSVQINTIARPPADSSAKPVSHERLAEIKAYFGEKAQIIAATEKVSKEIGAAGMEDVRNYLKRRPGSLDDISSSLGIFPEELGRMLQKLENDGFVVQSDLSGKIFWEYRNPDE